MSDRPKNLAPTRGPSVWDRPEHTGGWTMEDSERWTVAICGGALALLGVRQRSVGGTLLAAVAGAAAVRAMLGYRDISTVRHYAEQLGQQSMPQDEIDSASAGSFPASDAPSWTTTAGARVP